MANTLIANGNKIIVVDQMDALSYPADLQSDGVHPNANGYNKMADVWFTALSGILPSCSLPTPDPDLTIAKTHSGNFTQGQTGAVYTITITNSGMGQSNGTVRVTDTLPTGLTATAMSGDGWTCTLDTLTCMRNDVLAPSSSYPAITLTVNVAANAPASATNIANVSGGGEVNTANDTAIDVTTINILTPPAPVLTSPEGVTPTTMPIYAWAVVPGATSYTLYVDDGVSSIRYDTFSSAAICSLSACSAPTAVALTNGASYYWTVRGSNIAGTGPWAAGKTFEVMTATLPAAPVLTSPSGTIATTMPTYAWAVVPGDRKSVV